jgi:hypothetical protein
MNSFVRRHQNVIRFGYSCFDRIICQGMILAFQHSERAGTIAWFLRSQRQAEQLNRQYFGRIANDYGHWVALRALEKNFPLIEPEKDCRREDWVEPYYHRLQGQPGVAVILKTREPERIVIHSAKSNDLTVERRWVNVYSFYLNDAHCGRMWIRVCPYFPFNVRVWMNGHNWLALQMRQQGIAFVQRDNLFTDCDNPERLQQLADAFGPQDIYRSVDFWLPHLIPFFSAEEREQGYRHQLYMAQMEYCHNLIFHKQAALERLFDRLMDSNRTLGHPDKLAVVFGRPHFRPDTRTGQTVLKITKRRTPVITSSFKQTWIKQYVSHSVGLRTESASHQLKDLSVAKNIVNLPKLRQVLDTANQRYLEIQQDVLNSYVDRGQLQQFRQASVSATGRRVPGLRLDDPRLLALLQALTCFMYLAGKGSFRTKDLLPDVQKASNNPDYKLSQLRYDLSKLRGKGLVVRLHRTRSYQLTPAGYRLAILYLKLYQRLYAPLTAAIQAPDPTDQAVLSHRRAKLDKLYVAVDEALHKLAQATGVAFAA